MISHIRRRDDIIHIYVRIVTVLTRMNLDPSAYFRNVHGKWGFIAFILTVSFLFLVVVGNAVLGPVFFVIMNERPSKARNKLLNWPWIKTGLWIMIAVLTACCLCDTNFDLRMIAKRLGRVCVVLMPPLYFVTLRPSPLPHSFYLQLLPIHKFLSRFVVLMALAHGVVYTYVYFQRNMLHKLHTVPNVLGMLATLVFVAMGVTSFYRVRRRAFELFYQTHIIGSFICLPFIRWHAHPRVDYYLLMCLAILVFQIWLKIRKSCTTKLRVQFVSPSMLLITIPKALIPPSKLWNWQVASHIRLSGPFKNPLNWIRSTHPYTIASLPDDNSIKLVVRPGDYEIRMRREYTLFGPHACVPSYILHQIHSSLTKRVLIVIGGTGIAFGAPMMRYVSMHGTECRLVWAIRDPLDAKVLPQLGLHDEVLDGNVEIYYTGESLTKEQGVNMIVNDELLSVRTSDDCYDEQSTRPLNRSFTKDPILSQYSKFMYNSRPHLNLRLKLWLYGHKVDERDCCCADRVLETTPEDRLGAWLFACGTQNLCKSTKEWAENAGIGYFEDTFTL